MFSKDDIFTIIHTAIYLSYSAQVLTNIDDCFLYIVKKADIFRVHLYFDLCTAVRTIENDAAPSQEFYYVRSVKHQQPKSSYQNCYVCVLSDFCQNHQILPGTYNNYINVHFAIAKSVPPKFLTKIRRDTIYTCF